MSRDAVQTQILTPMQIAYQPAHALLPNERAAVLEGYVMALKQFDEPVLADAWIAVISTHRSRFWPVPGVIVAAAVGAARERRADSRRATPPRSIAKEREAHWQRAMRTPIALEAVAKGVAWSFKIAILDDNKSPEEFPMQKEADAKVRNERLAERIRDGLPLTSLDGRNIGVMKSPLREQALSWRETMLISEAKTQEEILAANASGTPS